MKTLETITAQKVVLRMLGESYGVSHHDGQAYIADPDTGKDIYRIAPKTFSKLVDKKLLEYDGKWSLTEAGEWKAAMATC